LPLSAEQQRRRFSRASRARRSCSHVPHGPEPGRSGPTLD
jgi:hypothetical protein